MITTDEPTWPAEASGIDRERAEGNEEEPAEPPCDGDSAGDPYTDPEGDGE